MFGRVRRPLLLAAFLCLVLAAPAVGDVISADISPNYQEKVEDSTFGWTVQGESTTAEEGTIYFGDGNHRSWCCESNMLEYASHTFTYPCSTRSWGQTWDYGGTNSYATARTINNTGMCR